jgi:hypothetical protein
VFHYPWLLQEHINALELHAVLSAVRWLLTFPSHMDCGVVFCVDSAVVCYALAKGRSSSFALLRLLRQLAAFCLASGLTLRPFWMRSADNPADAPSRVYQQQQQQRPHSRIVRQPPASFSAPPLHAPYVRHTDPDDDCVSDSDTDEEELSVY